MVTTHASNDNIIIIIIIIIINIIITSMMYTKCFLLQTYKRTLYLHIHFH